MTVAATEYVGPQEELLGLDAARTSSGPGWVSHRTRSVVVCSALLFAGTGTTGAPIYDPSAIRVLAPVMFPAGSQTAFGSAVRQGPAVGAAVRLRREGDEVRWLHETSGMTWEQLGRVFGVSRRAVHLWATGARMNAANAEALFGLVDLVRAAPGSTPDERRAWLLRPDSGGRSALDRFREARLGSFQINRPVLRSSDTVDTPTALAVSES